MQEAITELDRRASEIVKTIFDTGATRLYYINGDHNNMGYVINGFYQSTGIKPIVIYLDFHSDARPTEDGPHSGTWVTEAYERD